jgi:uncharacterized protein YabN with tetrapyrrole methylase and pyrophosphatase domain
LSTGSLTVVGTGIQFVGHLTLAAQGWIEQADKVFFGVADPAMAKWLLMLNSTAETLPLDAYADGTPRKVLYQELVERILAAVRQGLQVCAVFYGHPGVFVDAAHEAIRQARQEGFRAYMLPGISAEDCLFADLGLDPGRNGCQSFDATDFLIHGRQFDVSSPLILWQIAVVGDPGYKKNGYDLRNLPILVEVLTGHYGPDHEVIVYEAAVYPVCEPLIQPVPLTRLPEAPITGVSTLYVPPKAPAPVNRDMLARLGMAPAPSPGNYIPEK